MENRPKFQVYLNFYRLKSAKGDTVLTGEGYATRMECIRRIEHVRASALNNARYERAISGNNEYYFILRAPDGERIGKSEMYPSPKLRDEGIETVLKIAPIAAIEEFPGHDY
jgi:uncharacterized protein YegP (UPF0339 family)